MQIGFKLENTNN